MSTIQRCAYCGNQVFQIACGERRRAHQFTRDHIYPRQYGLRAGLGHDYRNTRTACLRCNNVRAFLQHCSGVLLIILSEARRRNVSIQEAGRVAGFVIPKRLAR